MNFHPFRSLSLIVLSLAALCGAIPNAQADSHAGVAREMDTLVSAKWLHQHLDDPDLVVLDCTVMVEADEQGDLRTSSGRHNYKVGHIPGAGFADLMGELSNTESPLEFGLPTPEEFVAAMSALGVSDDSRVVLYSANYPAWAARVWWMLRWIGFDRAALLDGGLAAWSAAGYPLSTESHRRAPGKLSLNLRPELIADRGEVLQSLEDKDVWLIDSMTEAHYRGEVAMYDRPGHIPGASNIPTTLLMDETGHFRPQDELEMLFDGDANDRTITYCVGGVAASANAFVLHRLGFTNVAVYAASLDEWAADPANPMELGEERGKYDKN
jgi:thiosulfate/3-mercaptopyruvate sulfurtransferase